MGVPLPDRHVLRFPEQRTETQVPYRPAHEYPLTRSVPIEMWRLTDRARTVGALTVILLALLVFVLAVMRSDDLRCQHAQRNGEPDAARICQELRR